MVNGKIPGTGNLLLIMGALVFLVELVAAWRARSWAGIPKTLLWTIALPLALYLIAPLVVGKTTPFWIDVLFRSEERRVGKSVSVRVDLGGRRIIKKKNMIKTKDRKTHIIQYKLKKR